MTGQNDRQDESLTSQNDWQDESLTGQVRDQAGHCPLTGRYLQPWKGKFNLKGVIGE